MPGPARPAATGREAAGAAAIETANAADPRTVTLRGETGPLELLHGRMVLEWVCRLRPAADELERLAALASHLRRWEHPRGAFPAGRAGYLRWRREAASRHATAVVDLLRETGYSSAETDRVAAIVRKDARRTDAAVQANEDARCLVFLEAQLDETTARLGVDRAVEVVARTAAKMSTSARALVPELPLGARGAETVRQALALLDAKARGSGVGTGRGGR